eukprot:2397924-Rhodomonas_salina.4
MCTKGVEIFSVLRHPTAWEEKEWAGKQRALGGTPIPRYRLAGGACRKVVANVRDVRPRIGRDD